MEGRKGAPMMLMILASCLVKCNRGCMMLMMLASRLVKCAQPLGGVGAASVWSSRVWRAGKEPR